MSDDDDNVVRPVFGSSADIFGLGHECQHQNYKMNADARLVTCGRCGSHLDPFDVLLQYARKERQWKQWSRVTSEKRQELHELEKEERRIKARVRNAIRKDADGAVAAERERHVETCRRLRNYQRSIEEQVRLMSRALQKLTNDVTKPNAPESDCNRPGATNNNREDREVRE